MQKRNRLPQILALYEKLGLARLAELEAAAIPHRPVPVELLARLYREEQTGLSPRQHEVMLLLAAGRTRGEIAAELGVGYETVKHHLRNAYRRLGARNSVEAVNIFLGRG